MHQELKQEKESIDQTRWSLQIIDEWHIVLTKQPVARPCDEDKLSEINDFEPWIFMRFLNVNLLTKTNCAQEGFIFKGETLCPFKDHVLYSIFAQKDYVAIQQDQIYALIDARSRLVLPASAASWIVSTIRNGFWKKPVMEDYQKINISSKPNLMVSV